MTPRQRIETVLRGESGDRVPFTIYAGKIPQSSVERRLRERGMCLIDRALPGYRIHTPDVTLREEVYWKDGRRHVRNHYETPVGMLSTLREEAGFTAWHHEKLFKSPEDYPALLFYLRDQQFSPDYESFALRQHELGEDVLLRAGFGLEPLQELISGILMRTEDFCEQWMEHRDEVMLLYETIVSNRRRVYPLVAESPALLTNYGVNVVVEIIGPRVFRELYVPHYQDAAEVMHRHGKFIGCHFHDDCRALAQGIADSGLDYIEAFIPAPDSDMSVAEARAAWPDKVLWLDFRSSQHLRPEGDIEQTAFELLEQNGSAKGLFMEVTEEMPSGRWPGNLTAIMNGLERHVRQQPSWYASAVTGEAVRTSPVATTVPCGRTT